MTKLVWKINIFIRISWGDQHDKANFCQNHVLSAVNIINRAGLRILFQINMQIEF